MQQGYLATFSKMLAEITLDEVNAAIKKYLQVENLWIAIVADKGMKLRDAIGRDDPSPISCGDIQKSAEILAEDEQIAVCPLKVPQKCVFIAPVSDMFSGKAKFAW